MEENTKGEILLYQTADGQSKIEVALTNDTVWLTLDQMAELFQRNKSTISRHIKTIFESGELQADSVVAFFATTAADKKTYQVAYYNLDMIISVGYKVNSLRGVQFRIWATQDKIHFSTHGHTAAEIIYNRADSEKDFMGLTTWTGALPRRSDTEYAKNYLSVDEIDTLNRIVSLYLDFAELQAQSHTPMYMKDWIQKLDDFLKLSGKELLHHVGKITAEMAKNKAHTEFDKFHERSGIQLSPGEIHFIENFEKEQKKITK